MMKMMANQKRRAMAGLAPDDGVRRRHAEPGRDGEGRREDAGGLSAGMPGARPVASRHARPAAEISGTCRALERRFQGSADFPALGKKK